MGWGILEDRSVDHVPGTTLIDEKSAHAESHTGNLKHVPGHPEVILVPQPSDDPNDPLNWGNWEKDFYTILVSIIAMISCGTLGPILIPGTVSLITEFGLDFAQLSQLTGYQLLAIACAGPVVVVLARLWGRRPVFVISGWIVVVGSIMAAAAPNYECLLASRIIQGLGAGAYEGIVTPFIGDMFFVHQRGSRISIYVMFLWMGSMFGLIPTGVITENMGWRWTFGFCAIFLGILNIAQTLLVPETAYNRPDFLELDTTADDVIDTLNAKKAAEVNHTEAATNQPPRKSFTKRMAMYNGRFSQENFFKMVARPWAALLQFPLFWNMIFTGMPQVFSVGISYVLPQVFSPPPYNLTASEIGFIGAGPVAGVVCATLFTSFTSDWVALWFARHNGGVYEPEFRLWMTFPTIIVTGIGVYGFGMGIEAGQGPVVAAVFFGFAIASVVMTINTGFTYMLDAYRSFSMEIFVAAMSFKNFMFFGFAYFINNWIADYGPRRMFIVCGSVNVGLLVTALPIYIFGKKIRAYYSRYDLLKALGLK